MTEKCSNCKFWEPWPPRDGQESKCGSCFGEPPVPSFQKGVKPQRPWTFQDDVCRYYVRGENRKPRQMKSSQHQGGGNYGTKDEIPFAPEWR